MHSLAKLGCALLCAILLTGCTGPSNLFGCGEAYENMYGGDDYTFTSKEVDQNNALNVTVKILNGAAGWLEGSDEKEVDTEVYVTLRVKNSAGDETVVDFQSSTWEINGDSEDGSNWVTYLWYQSPDGFCDDGCDKVNFVAGFQDGFIYYDGTCDTSPWVDVD
ncbi:MAG: hypothetical protein P8R03_05580 [Candidatus Poseidoniaceae archaeon]|nr:hypothetical protein [Candidatus Poseidoniaceae archaeon]